MCLDKENLYKWFGINVFERYGICVVCKNVSRKWWRKGRRGFLRL